ncbi:MAG: BMP family ABC transporter substrate-binding protein [Spirochaetia bacterium]|nr:BMP family ABC transporter substrate-binding protein [Spirochaetia bacterium]
MKKTVMLCLSVLTGLGMLFANGTSEKPAAASTATSAVASATTASGLPALTKDTIKVGFIYGSPVGTEGYSYCHDLGRRALEKEGIKTMYLESISETSACEKAMRDLINQGCNVIYATSFGYGEYVLSLAKEYPDVYFNHATGYQTAKNVSTYMGRLYEAEYLTGMVAGMMTKSNQIGFVASFPLPEVVRQINAYMLGAKAVNPKATIEVKWTNSWYDPATETASAKDLVNDGCDVLGAYCDTMNPQSAAARMGKWVTGCSSSGYDALPDKYLTAPLFHYDVFYPENVNQILDGTWKADSKWEGIDHDVVDIDKITNCPPEVSEKVMKARQDIIDKKLDIWKGELKDNKGKVRVEAGQTLTDSDLTSLDWFVDGVIGSVK